MTKINVTTRQFKRAAGMTEPGAPPVGLRGWQKLRDASAAKLKAMGFAVWESRGDTTLMLVPGEWYDAIPEGFSLETITGKFHTFKRGKSDPDIRFGALAYGIRVKAK